MNGMTMPQLTDDIGGWAIVGIGTLITLVSIVLAIYWTIKPGESQPNHPKRLILRKDR